MNVSGNRNVLLVKLRELPSRHLNRWMPCPKGRSDQMKFKILSVCALACICLLVACIVPAQDNQPADVKVSDGERAAAAKVDEAKGTEAKLQAADAFVHKYPKSALRPKMAEALSNEIADHQNKQLQIGLAENYLNLFNNPGEDERIVELLLRDYINAGRADGAFNFAAARLARNPNDVDLLRSLAIAASNESINGHNAYAAQGLQYGTKAIAMIESDQKPEGIEDAKWATYKAEWLPALYLATGIIALKTNDQEKSLAHLRKAAALKSTDPRVYILLSDFIYDEYDRLVEQYNVAPPAGKQAALAKAEAAMDKAIEAYAEAVGMTEGAPEYQEAHDTLKRQLTTFYKFRHNNSDAGLQQLIDRYKKPAQSK
jgi:hypothetical protein